MSKHTPGPWAPLFGEHPNPAILGPTGKSIAHAIQRDDWRKGDGITRETAEENARLIAAAPDLLAALQDMIRWMPSYPSGADGIVGGREAHAAAIEAARAAIAKAEGVSR